MKFPIHRFDRDTYKSIFKRTIRRDLCIPQMIHLAADLLRGKNIVNRSEGREIKIGFFVTIWSLEEGDAIDGIRHNFLVF